MSFNKNRRGFTLVELMVVIGILGLLVGILAVAVLPKLMSAKGDLEKKQMGELYQALELTQNDNGSKKKLKSSGMAEKTGRAFWNDCFKNKILADELIKKIVCLGSAAGDTPATSEVFEKDGKGLEESNCSYTSPKAGELASTINLKGSQKVVLITFDSRNWFSYKDKGALCSWTEGGTDYIDQALAELNHKITAGDWEQPKLILGKKYPFTKTFEEKQ